MALSHRLPQKQWIRQRREYQRIQSTGRRFRQPHLTMLYTPGSTANSRFGITVSRRVGNAVTRNRVKRWIREVVRSRWTEVASGWELVIIARPAAAAAGLMQIETEFQAFADWHRGRHP